MAHHFYRDPVMPGSVGIEALFQTLQAYLWHCGLLDEIPDARCAPAVGSELSWQYRGQILAEHHRMRGEVHVREVRREGDGLVAIADGSVWRDDLRIYEAKGVAISAVPGKGTGA